MGILMAALADSIALEALTVVAGNVEFDYQVENAKYTLQLAGMADEVPVYEGARTPLVKDHEHVDHVHGDGGLGGELYPDTGIPSAEQHAVDAIVETVRESPGEVSLACIGPLTNIALAIRREPNLNDLVDEFWLWIFPLVLGEGERLFEDGTIPAALELTKAETSSTGVQMVRYGRSGEIEYGPFALNDVAE
jgi:inosine-uridine nucleoside N-ribohydrolase